MSSVQEKSSKIAFKNILIRQGSLDKIKCTAYSTLGSMFPKKFTAISVLEDAMNSSRTFIQIPVLTIILPSIHIFCVAMSLLINLIRRQKFVMGISFEKLDAFITEFNRLKRRRQRTSLSDQKKVEEHIDKINGGVSKSQNSDKKINDYFEPATQLKITEPKTDRLLIIASYMSILFVYVQFSCLLYLIGLSTLKLGMLFMLSCVVTIAYLIAKISFLNAKSLQSSRRSRSRRLKAVKQKLFGKALTLGTITCVLPQIKFNTCGREKCSSEKEKLL